MRLASDVLEGHARALVEGLRGLAPAWPLGPNALAHHGARLGLPRAAVVRRAQTAVRLGLLEQRGHGHQARYAPPGCWAEASPPPPRAVETDGDCVVAGGRW